MNPAALQEYGGRFIPVESLHSVLENFQEGRAIRCAGRLMARRIMGKSTFGDLKDETARMQIYGKGEELGAEGFHHFKSLGIGDFLGSEGTLFVSKTGEKSI